MKVLVIGLIAAGTLASAVAQADTHPLKPVKVTAAAAAGPIFDSKQAVSSDGPDGHVKDVNLLKSADKKVEMGMYQAGASDQAIASYPVDEFCYFLSGSVRLTSADGTVLEVKAGEGVAIPRGWKGRWTTKGYSKYYVTYESK